MEISGIFKLLHWTLEQKSERQTPLFFTRFRKIIKFKGEMGIVRKNPEHERIVRKMGKVERVCRGKFENSNDQPAETEKIQIDTYHRKR